MERFDNGAYVEKIENAAAYIKDVAGSDYKPAICIVAGSGLAKLAGICEDVKDISCKDIPGFPVSTAPGHEGRLIAGKMYGKDVMIMSGRVHYYEGYDMRELTFYVRVASVLGVTSIILTNAAGGIFEEGESLGLMAVTDHISFNAEPVLRGPNLVQFGTRFPDQSYVYDREYISFMEDISKENGINLKKGVYAYTKGPQYETPAEIRMLKLCGASVVGMSTVPEAICASHCGMRIAAISIITNLAAGISANKLSEQEVIENADKASDDAALLIRKLVERI